MRFNACVMFYLFMRKEDHAWIEIHIYLFKFDCEVGFIRRVAVKT